MEAFKKGREAGEARNYLFDPIFQPYLWGGRRLAEWFAEAPGSGPVAEAWLVSVER